MPIRLDAARLKDSSTSGPPMNSTEFQPRPPSCFEYGTQSPVFSEAFLMRRSACGPCPCPSEIESTFRPFDSANLSKLNIGSTPGESTNTSGDVDVESANVPSRSNGGGSVYFCPSSSQMKAVIAGTSLSSRKTRRKSSFWKSVSLSTFSGRSAKISGLCGSGESRKVW